MYIHNINPTLFSFGPFEIRFYGIVYAVALVFLIYYLQRAARAGKVKNLTPEHAMDLIIYSMLAMLICARLGQVLTHLPYYSDDPLQILAFWRGGLTFFGGFVGVILAVGYLVRRWKIEFFEFADIVVIPIPLILMFGRIANFINGEIAGKVTSVSWAVKFPAYLGYRHPSQLYEAFAMLLLFLMLLWLSRVKLQKKLQNGFLFGCFVALYGGLRFIVEFYKELDLLQLFGLSWTHYLSFVMLVVGVVMVAKVLRSKSE